MTLLLLKILIGFTVTFPISLIGPSGTHMQISRNLITWNTETVTPSKTPSTPLLLPLQLTLTNWLINHEITRKLIINSFVEQKFSLCCLWCNTLLYTLLVKMNLKTCNKIKMPHSQQLDSMISDIAYCLCEASCKSLEKRRVIISNFCFRV